MIEARDFIDACLKREFSFWSGQSSQALDPLVRYAQVSRNLEWVAASSGGESLAIALGATLAGRPGVAVCPSTSVGSLADPLSSLVYPYRMPLLLVISENPESELAGAPDNELQGKRLGGFLRQLGIESAEFPTTPAGTERALEEALEMMESSGLPFAFRMKGPCVADVPTREPLRVTRRGAPELEIEFQREPGERMPRREAVRILRETLTGEEALVASTGGPGRELIALGHRSNQFYVPASTGCAAAVGLGVARARRRRDVVVLDGDGSGLRGLSSLVTIGHYAPPRFLHIMLDDEVAHAPTGEPSMTSSVEVARVAAACGYANVWWTEEPEELSELVRAAQKQKGPTFLHVKVAAGEEAPGEKPRRSPVQVKHQFMDWVQER